MEKIKAGETLVASLIPLDAQGKPTVFDGKVNWASSDPTAVSVTPSEDTLTATVTGLRANSSATITAEADGAHGEGVNMIRSSGVVSVSPTDVSTAEMKFAAPAPAPAPEVEPAPVADTANEEGRV